MANKTGLTSSFSVTSTIVSANNYQFAPDRFNNTNASMFFNSGYVQVPPEIYFDGTDFTIIMWVKTTQVFWQSLLDFGDTNLTNNVIFQLDSSIRPNFEITVGTSKKWYFSSTPLVLNQWNHMVATLKGMILKMYLNGIQISQETIAVKPANLTRPTCYIGRSNAFYKNPSANPDAKSYIDGVYIYNRAFTQDEVIADMMSG